MVLEQIDFPSPLFQFPSIPSTTLSPDFMYMYSFLNFVINHCLILSLPMHVSVGPSPGACLHLRARTLKITDLGFDRTY